MDAQEQIAALIPQVERWLEAMGILSIWDEDMSAYGLAMNEESVGTWSVFVNLDQELGRVFIFSIYPDEIPEAALGEAALWAARVNATLAIGSVDLNLDDAVVLFKIALDLHGLELTEEAFVRMLTTNIRTMRGLIPQLREVCAKTRAGLN